jgi:hypothetical protein
VEAGRWRQQFGHGAASAPMVKPTTPKWSVFIFKEQKGK